MSPRFAPRSSASTTVCVEMDKTLGGTCVNVGCIPSKALLTSLGALRVRATHAAEHGISVGGVALDLAHDAEAKGRRRAAEHEGASSSCSGRTRSRGPRGAASLGAGNVVTVDRRGREQRTTIPGKERHHCDGLGADRAAVPEVRRGARALERRRAHDSRGPEAPHRDRRRRHRPRARLRVAPTRRQGHGRRAHARRFFRAWTTTSSRKRTASSASRASRSAPGTKVTSGERAGDHVFVDVEKDGASETLDGRLRARLRRPPTVAVGGIDATALGLKVSKRGEVLVDDQMRTNLPNVFAIGDCVPAARCSRTRRRRKASSRPR